MFAGFIRTLATIVLVWFAFRWLDRMFGGTRAKKKRKAGGTKSGTKSDSRKPKDDNIGEYVDFEEIEK